MNRFTVAESSIPVAVSIQNTNIAPFGRSLALVGRPASGEIENRSEDEALHTN